MSMTVAVATSRAMVALALGLSSCSLKFSMRSTSVSAAAEPRVMRTVLTVSPAAKARVPASPTKSPSILRAVSLRVW
ncbi:hypothetical protein D3C81_2267410 [compost metagenome]